MLLINFLGLIRHHHWNPCSKLYLWFDFQTCTPSVHRELEHGVPHGGPDQFLGADLTSSFKSLVKTILVARLSGLYPFRPQRTGTWGPSWWPCTTSWGWFDIIIQILGQNYTCGVIFRPVPLQTTENRDMGSPMVVLNNFLGLIWHDHSNPWSTLYLWCDFQTCTPSDHREL